MRDELISFQQIAVSKLLAEINSAQAYHRVDGRPQVIAFRAPTGSGKTIVMTEVIEDILNGTETTVEQPACFSEFLRVQEINHTIIKHFLIKRIICM